MDKRDWTTHSGNASAWRRPSIAAAAMLSLVASLPLTVLAGDPASGRLALRGARVLSLDRSGETTLHPRATVVVEGGRVVAVGEAVPVPENAAVVDLDGSWLLPGFVDAHYLVAAHLGESDEYTRPTTEEFDALAAVDPWAPELEQLLERGVTSLAISPGNLNVVGGRVRLIKVVPGAYPLRVVEGATVYKASLGLEVLGGSMARYPTSLSGAGRLLREWIEERREARGDGVTPAEETLAERLLIHVDNRMQVERALRSCREASLMPAIIHARNMDLNAWRRLVGDPQHVVLGPYDLADTAATLAIAAALEQRGVALSFATDGSPRDLLTSAVLCQRHGLSLGGALGALTLHPARLLGVDDRLGCIQPGHDADLVAWSGNPFTLTARVLGVWVDGARVHTAAQVSEPKPSTKASIETEGP